MRICGYLGITVCLLVLAAVRGLAYDPGPASADFNTRYKDWKQVIARMYQIQELYKTDRSADKKNLETEFNQLMQKAQDDLPPVMDAAEKAYLEAPNENKELNAFLLTNLVGFIQSDDYEKAARLSQIMLEHKFEAKELDLLAGVAFFATNQYDLAGEHLQAAKDSGTITRPALQFLGQIDKYKEMWQREERLRAAEEKANNLPKVQLTTSQGDIVIALFENEAPIATANFISLVEKKFFDGLSFHRVIGGFMAQTGDPKGDGTGGPGYTIPCECYNEKHRNHFRGSLSMAHTGQRDSGGSQFYITFLPTSHLDGKHTVFGRVIEGMDVLAKLQRIQPGEPGTPDKIIKAKVLSKRRHPYVPVTKPDKK